MKYLIHKCQSEEIKGRQEYLYDIFRLYFIPHNIIQNYIPLIPLGIAGPNILFITGHTDQVEQFICNNIASINETAIVATTCMPDRFKIFTNKKRIYVPNISGNICHVRDGSAYGFSFNPSDAELDMYNATGNIWQRIEAGYRLLNKEAI